MLAALGPLSCSWVASARRVAFKGGPVVGAVKGPLAFHRPFGLMALGATLVHLLPGPPRVAPPHLAFWALGWGCPFRRHCLLLVSPGSGVEIQLGAGYRRRLFEGRLWAPGRFSKNASSLGNQFEITGRQGRLRYERTSSKTVPGMPTSMNGFRNVIFLASDSIHPI